jgi:DNA-binding MarR family transcriptional regulator
MSSDVLKDCERTHELMQRFWLHLGSQLTTAVLQGRLNMPQHNSLVALRMMGEITMGQLARRLGVTMGAATNVVDKLVDAGYVERRHDETDRRIVKVKLTSSGQKVLDDTVQSFKDYAKTILCQVPPQERQGFLDTFAKIVELSEAQDIRTPRKGRSPRATAEEESGG